MGSLKWPWLTTRQRRPSGSPGPCSGRHPHRHVRATRLPPDQRPHQTAGRQAVAARKQPGVVPGLPIAAFRAQFFEVADVLRLPGAFPEVMVVVAGQVVDGVSEEPGV